MCIYLIKLTKEEYVKSMYHDDEAFVVRANSPKAARQIVGSYIAEKSMGSESSKEESRDYWNDPKKTSCDELTSAGEPGVIVVSEIKELSPENYNRDTRDVCPVFTI